VDVDQVAEAVGVVVVDPVDDSASRAALRAGNAVRDLSLVVQALVQEADRSDWNRAARAVADQVVAGGAVPGKGSLLDAVTDLLSFVGQLPVPTTPPNTETLVALRRELTKVNAWCQHQSKESVVNAVRTT
jgi:hypothetical protein